MNGKVDAAVVGWLCSALLAIQIGLMGWSLSHQVEMSTELAKYREKVFSAISNLERIEQKQNEAEMRFIEAIQDISDSFQREDLEQRKQLAKHYVKINTLTQRVVILELHTGVKNVTKE